MGLVTRSLDNKNIKYTRSLIIEIFIALFSKAGIIKIKKKDHNSRFECVSDNYYGGLSFVSMMPQYANDAKSMNTKQPLCQLDKSEIEKGEEILKTHGVDPIKKFVAFHVRDDEFHPEQDLDFRNGSILNMIPSLTAIEERGYMSFRMGAVQEEINSLDFPSGMINYSNTFRSEFMDAYLVSQSEFFIGNTSGFFGIPFLFNVPQLSINMIPLHDTGLGVNDIYLPKMLWSIDEKRLLSFSEILNISRNKHLDPNFYRKNRIRPIENTAEEIENGVIELFMKIDGTLEYDDEYNYYASKLEKLYPECSYGFYSDAEISKYFIKKYSYLL